MGARIPISETLNGLVEMYFVYYWGHVTTAPARYFAAVSDNSLYRRKGERRKKADSAIDMVLAHCQMSFYESPGILIARKDP